MAIKAYHADNEVLNTSAFMGELLEKQKILGLVGLEFHIKGQYSDPSRQWLL